MSVRRRGPWRAFGERCVRDVTSIVHVGPVDGAVVSRALAVGVADVEEAVTAAAAAAGGCVLIVARDPGGFRDARSPVQDSAAALTAIRVCGP